MAGGDLASSHQAEAKRRRYDNLEVEHVIVQEGFEFKWHRPPLEEVRRQAEDPDTIRIFVNGCFDLMHVGHFNVLRQAKAFFYSKGYKKVTLVAGIHCDASITKQKGPPIMNNEERIDVLRVTKWVDEVVSMLPYVSMSAKMADALSVQWICHGDDLPVVKGGDGMYSNAIDTGRFQVLKRTEGISTTQILERMLRRRDADAGKVNDELGSCCATMTRLQQFAAPPDPWFKPKSLPDSERVVYVPGIFDLLHGGHVHILERAAQLGDYVLVGLHSDDVVRRWRGSEPVLTILERAMSVLSLGIVDDVVMGAPWSVTQDLITSMKISVVLGRSSRADSTAAADECDRYTVAKTSNIFTSVDSGPSVTTSDLIRRFQANHKAVADRNAKLFAKELAYVDNKEYVAEA